VGPVGATLAFGLVWALGRAAAYGVPPSRSAGAGTGRAASGGAVCLELAGRGAPAVRDLHLLDLGGQSAWSGRWGFAAALVLRSALGDIGSWIVAGTLFAVTRCASELGFHWIEHWSATRS